MGHGMVVSHHMRSLMPAFCTDKYLGFQFEDRVDWLNQLKPHFALAVVAVHRGGRLDKVTHVISFRSTLLRSKKKGRSNVSRSKDWLKAERPGLAPQPK